MPRADHAVAFHFTLAERAAAMEAYIVDTVEFTINVGNSDIFPSS